MINIALLTMQTFVVVLTMFCSLTMLITLFRNRSRLFSDPESKNHPSVSIAVPVYNGAATIGRTLQSLLDLNYPQKPEIIVVDDASKDDTVEVVKRFGNRIRLIRLAKNSGRKAVPLNVALKHAKGDIFGFIDDDTIADRNLLVSTIGYFENKCVGAVVPAMKIQRSKSLLGQLQKIEYMLTVLSRKLLSFLNGLYLTPGCAFYRTDVLRQLRGFDIADLTEDLEIGLRLRKAGWRIENSLNATVWTAVPDTIRDVSRQRIRWYRGLLQNIRKYKSLLGQRTDMGLFVMPFVIIGGTIGILLYFATMVVALASFLWDTSMFIAGMGLSGWDVSLILDRLVMQPNIFLFLTGLFIVLFTVNVIFSAKAARESIWKSAIYILVFMLIYGPLLGLWWVISVLQEAVGVKGRW